MKATLKQSLSLRSSLGSVVSCMHSISYQPQAILIPKQWLFSGKVSSSVS